MQLKVRGKLLLGFGTLLFLLIVVGGIGLFMLENVSGANNEAIENMETIIQSVESEVDHLAWSNELADTFIAQTQFHGELDHHSCGFGQWFYETIESEEFQQTSPRFREAFMELEDPHRRLHESAARIVDIYNDHGAGSGVAQNLARDIYTTETQPILEEVRAGLDEIEEILYEENEQLVAYAAAQAGLGRTVIIIGAVISVLVGLGATFIINRNITKPINNIVASLKELAQQGGDLTRKIEANSKDEIGDLAYWFNSFVGKLADLVRSIADKAEQVASSSEELTASCEENTSSANEVAKSVEDIAKGANDQATSTDKASQNVDDLGQLIEKDQNYMDNLNQTAEKVDQLKNEGSEIVVELTNNTKESEAAFDEVQEAVGEIRSSADKINSATVMISDIAEQTNLLALNAAIEAARAGEAGKGFAVVAEEVRKLAEQSSEYTEEINKIIYSLVEKSEKTVGAMQKLSSTAQSQSNSVSGTKEKFDGIATAIQETKEIIADLNKSGNEMSSKKDEIVETLQNLSAIAEENSAGTEEISSSIQEQNTSIEEVTKASEELAKIAEDMQNEMAQFKY